MPICASCGQANPEGARFCNQCGAQLTPRGGEAERRVVTALFCDIVGSTSLGERTDPEELGQLLSRYFDLAREVIEGHGGEVEKFIGDAVAAVFGYPVAHEDDPVRAITAALEISERVEESGLGLEVRLAVNTGEAFVRAGSTPGEWTAVGDVMNTTSRLQGAAPKLGVVVGARTRSAAASAFEFAELPPLQLKGKEGSVAAWRVLGTAKGRIPEAAGAPLVGRAGEFARLSRTVANLDGRGGAVVLVEGEAGIGKSRLVREIRVASAGVSWLRGRSIETRDAGGYRPFAELVRDWISSPSWESLTEKTLGLDLDRHTAGFLAAMAGIEPDPDVAQQLAALDAEAMRPSLYRSVLAWLDALSASGPLVLEFEDWHWADGASVQLAEHVLPLVETRPLILLAITRPGSAPGDALSAVVTRRLESRLERLELAPLSTEDAGQLLEKLVAGRPISTERVQNALGRAEGNPYFLHELSRFLSEEREDGTLPDSVRAVVTARVDRLDSDLRGLLRRAAVIGRSFPDALLERLDPDGSVQPRLELLAATGLIEQMSDDRHRFVHALTREAVYEASPIAERKHLHAEVAALLTAENLPANLPAIAYHLAQSEDWESAAAALLDAGEQAARLAADDDALEMYRAAIKAHEHLPVDRWDPLKRSLIDRQVAEALVRLGRHDEAIRQVVSALARLGLDFPVRTGAVKRSVLRQLVPRLLGSPRLPPPGNTPTPAEIEINRELELVGWITFFTDHNRFALASLMLTNRAARAGDLDGLAVGVFRSSIAFLALGREKLSRQYMTRAHEAAARLTDPIELARLKQGLSLVPIGLGGYEEARRDATLGLELATSADDLRSRGAAGAQLAVVEAMHGDYKQARSFAESAIRAAEDGGERAIQGIGYCGLAVASEQDPAAAAAAAKVGIELAPQIPDFLVLTCCLGFLARAQLRLGDVAGAAKSVESGLRELSTRGFRGWIFAALFEAQAELALLELARDRNRSTIARSKQAVKRSLQQAHMARWFAIYAHTEAATRAWLLGNKRTALRSFARAEALAERYDWSGALTDASEWAIHCCTVAEIEAPSHLEARVPRR